MTCNAACRSGLCPCVPPPSMLPKRLSSNPMIDLRYVAINTLECLASGGRPRRKDPQRITRQFEPALAGGRRVAVAAQAQLAQLEKIFAPVAEEHSGDDFGADAILGSSVGD